MSVFYQINVTSAFFLSVIFGVTLRLYFDIFRIIRKLRCVNFKVLTIAEDLIYTVSSSVLLFFFSYAVSGGVFRLYEIVGIIIGALFYHYTASDIIVKTISIILLKIFHFFAILYKNTVIRTYIYLDKFYKKGKIIIEKNKKKSFNKKLTLFFLKLKERNVSNGNTISQS